MQVTRKNTSKTKVLLSVKASEAVLKPYKTAALKKLAPSVKIAGFRDGKAPLEVIEKNLDQQALQSEFVEQAINGLYVEAVKNEDIRPVDNPKITIKKLVPYSLLEFDAEVDVLGEVKLFDYKKIKKTYKNVSVTDKDIDEVIKSLLERMAESKEVKRAAKSGDKVTIDFKGIDSKKQPIKGADGKDYPLLLGSGSFIPGFEEKLIGLKAGDEKSFDITFPKDYGVKSLASAKVNFTVKVKKVEEQALPDLDDKFASQAGPFKSVDELKKSIKAELTRERETQAATELEGEIVKELSEKSELEIPEALIDDQLQRLMTELRQNLLYSGLTFEEFLEREGKTEDEYHKKVVRPEAEQRVRAGLVLAEVADKEKIQVTPEELEIRMQLLRGQYQDPAMQAELDKPESRQTIGSRMVTEKTIQKLVDYATK